MCHQLFNYNLCIQSLLILTHYLLQDEKIGDVFVASFSKSVVLEIYADFINNFSEAMDLAKCESKRKSAFGDFLKVGHPGF